MTAASDPLLDLIIRYREAESAWNANSRADSESPEARLFLRLYDELHTPPPATTKEGAIAALRLLLSELEHTEDPELAESLVGAAVAFLDSGSEVAP